MADLLPVKASLIADLVELVNENLGALLHARTVACPDCGGTGIVGEPLNVAGVYTSQDQSTCASCGGVGAVERYELDMEQLQKPRIGRLIEGFELKQGQLLPRFRSKDKAFATLVKLLGLERAVVEIANGTSFAEALSPEQHDAYVEQLKELAQMGLLDRVT
jgi:hypothetical protein